MDIDELLTSIDEYDDVIGGITNGRTILDRAILSRHVTRVVNDHRHLEKGDIFVALNGTDVDSHEFIADARDQQCALIIGEHASSRGDEPDLTVTRSRAAIGPIAHVLFGRPSEHMTIVGVTGTNGKTTTTYLYSAILRAHEQRCFTMGTTGILIDGVKEDESQTTPDPALIHQYFSQFRSDGATHGAMEVSSHALDQYRVLGTKFAAVAFTNFSQDHLDYHTTMEEYFAAKSLLFSNRYAPYAVVNIDDERAGDIVEIALRNGQEVTTVSCTNMSVDVFIETVDMHVTGSRLIAHVLENGEVVRYPFDTTLIGAFNYENIAVALGLALVTKCDIKKSIEALRNPDIIPGRLQRVQGENSFSAFVDYAHTPDALERVLITLKPLAKKLIVVFGCGGDRDRAKRPQMGTIASRLADTVIVTSDNPRSEDPMEIIDDIRAGIEGDCIVEPERREAIAMALKMAQPGDAVVIAGKGHEHGQVFADHVEEFSDIDVVNELLAEM